MSNLEAKELLKDLNAAQREAVTHIEGPLLVLAGPGSGKTRVITYRVAYLTAIGIDPQSIVAVTFTNKAADEMAGRILAMVGRRGVTICTFHSLCARLLRRYGERAGIDPRYSIFDQSDKLKAIKQAIESCGLSSENFPPGKVESTISRFKDQMLKPEDVASGSDDFYTRTVGRIYEAYEQILRKNNALDFDDLLMKTAELLGRDEQLRRHLQEHYRYVLVDEYQDTNYAQYLIARHLSSQHRNLAVTGDPDQSIYGWRGADLSNILRFDQDHPDAKLVRLEQNYRSTRTILAAADALISHNTRRKRKRLWTDNEQGVPITLDYYGDEHDEAEAIAERITELVASGRCRYGQIAVFYRTNALSRVIEEHLIRAGIPYQVVRGVEFYNRKEIKDVLAYLRILINPSDDVSLLRVINTPPRGIGATTIGRLQRWAAGKGVSLHAAIHDEKARAATGRSASKLAQFAAMLDRWQQHINGPLTELLEMIVRESGLEENLKQQASGEGSAYDNVAELVSSAAEFEAAHPDTGLIDYLQQVSLVSDVDRFDPQAGTVALMTLHAAKGLEFEQVFIIALEDGMLPHSRSAETEFEIEEERRLLFVGMTRAKAGLALSLARYRTVRGISQPTIESPFLQELPNEHLKVSDHSEQLWPARPASVDMNLATGQLVRHEHFGIGRVRSISNAGGFTRAVVSFNTAGTKTLILEFANLQKIDEAN